MSNIALLSDGARRRVLDLRPPLVPLVGLWYAIRERRTPVGRYALVLLATTVVLFMLYRFQGARFVAGPATVLVVLAAVAASNGMMWLADRWRARRTVRPSQPRSEADSLRRHANRGTGRHASTSTSTVCAPRAPRSHPTSSGTRTTSSPTSSTWDGLLKGRLPRDLDALAMGRPVADIGAADGDLAFALEQIARVGGRPHRTAHANHNGMQGARALKEQLGSNVGIHGHRPRLAVLAAARRGTGS